MKKEIVCIMVLLLCVSVAHADLKVDIGRSPVYASGGTLLEGWQAFTRVNDVPLAVETYVTALGNDDLVGVQLFNPSTWRDLEFEELANMLFYNDTRAGAMTHSLGDMLFDITFTGFGGNADSDRLEVTLTNVKAGTYSMTSYHHVAGAQWGSLDIYVDGTKVKDNVAYTTGVNPTLSEGTGKATYDIVSDGSSDIVIEFVVEMGDPIEHVAFSGFEIAVTEPPIDPDKLEINVDIGSYGQGIQAGWDDFTPTYGTTDGVINHEGDTRLFPVGQGSNYREILVKLNVEDTFDPNGFVYHTGQGLKITGGPYVGMSNLLYDRAFIFQNGMQIDITGIEGYYTVKTYHHDPNTALGNIDIYVDDADGTEQLKVDDLTQSTGSSPSSIATAEFSVNAGESGQVTIYVRLDGSNYAVLNGIDIVANLGECGATGTIYLDSDFDSNCVVDLRDFAYFVSEWLGCTHPDPSNCP